MARESVIAGRRRCLPASIRGAAAFVASTYAASASRSSPSPLPSFGPRSSTATPPSSALPLSPS
uniref:Uncharacterized protein n=1 Tax=Arundo donax TaxID=35708 RepID=A0A0A8Z944_ARUDO